MPLIRIDLVEGRPDTQITAIGDVLMRTLVDVYGLPERDRFQIVTEHAPGRLTALDVGLGIERSEQVVIIQIFTQAGRSTEEKQEFFRVLADSLAEVGVAGEDLVIGFVENTAADWSFGFGRAQYVTGELQKPGS
ncbi:tautomerase family protein [Clavibacter sepedonicus]|uniref:Tautomerase n=1 Tax=Clavibacter sepedonicus TaxID=31964 RepID=B0RBR2_CLASE|nr:MULTISPECIES: tautomerase family protein [Clavibacter]MBD5382176.1 tautomerase family protein [Clavibacter sp.]OQJ48892.1 tautomerase family protein [Clavibacter sepedonicus]OQJ53797.1 tautomerase family protein [Clavibacter sepedonicus]UUK65305.1 tautomerase family protein [Clavibacter sepedonicus]CAQ00463.1 putative tautomerase [Clavibacter sepedonicus]